MIGWPRGRQSRRDPDDGDFRPLPLLGNAHVQTLLAHWLRRSGRKIAGRRHVVWMPDGDGLVAHESVPDGWEPGDRAALLVHGLTGSHASPMICRLAADLLAAGCRVFRMDLRGCGAGFKLARRCYHGGRSDDLRAVAQLVTTLAPGSPLTLIGISLGGNISLKLAGEAAERPVPGLAAVATLGPPIDLERCAGLLSRRQNRIYEVAFLRELVSQAGQRQRLFPDLPPLGLPRKMTMRLFDDLYTAPRGGFADALDYYRSSSSARLIARIQVPTLILTARDDPFVAAEPFEQLKPPAHVEVCILRHGGHLGFLGRDGAGGFRWAERRLVEWVTREG